MLSELKLSNFRIFDDEVTVRFRPITVFIGRNSSGKSSIIKFMLMLQQSTMSTNSRFPVVNGSNVKMGTFSELKNSMTKKASLGFELSMQAPFSNRGQSVSRTLQRYEEADRDNLLVALQAEVPYGERDCEGAFTYSLKQVDSAAPEVTFVSSVADDYTFSADAFVRKTTEIQTTMEQIKDPNNRDPKQADHLKELLDEFLEKVELGMFLQSELASAYHLPPVRVEPERVIVTSRVPVDNVGLGGAYSVAHLQRIMTEDTEAYEFLLPHLRNVAGIDSIGFEPTSGDATQAFARSRTTGANVLIADYGFGVGQSLPVFVQGALMPQHTTLMVEQPEAQLHLTAQLEMGSFFADLWNTRNVGSVIETHSDNILLRLRRLIARGELSHQDVSVAFFTFDEDNGNMPVIKNLDINEDGSMEAGLPMEFFGANLIEGLQLGART